MSDDNGKAVIYFRVSTDQQAESGLGLEAQRAECLEWCAENGYSNFVEFTDAGVSGGKAPDERNGLLDAINALESGDVLLAAKRDRFARDAGYMGMLERMADKAGADLISAAGEGTQGDDPIASMFERRMRDMFAEYERLQTSVRTKAALREKRAKGERCGEIPYGKTLADDGVKLDENEREQRIVEIVCELRDEGLSYRDIADELGERGFTNRAGNDFHANSVRRIYKNAS
jgi:DNA invertase Pin-like site-specific DNA recombinase